MQPLLYTVEAADLQAHTFAVSLRIASPAALQTVSLPVWIPGSYMVREFAKHMVGMRAHQGGQALALVQQDKCSWRVAAQPGVPLVICCEVHAHDASVRTAWLDGERGFFNGTSLCLRVHGQEHLPHQMQLLKPASRPDWQAATGLQPVATTGDGFGLYAASSYDELVDCPVEMGAFWQGQFEARGVAHRFVVAGAWPSFDGARLLADAQAICQTQLDFWHGQPAPNGQSGPGPHGPYVFLLNAVGDGYGGLEHRNSTALICKRADLPRTGEQGQSEGYTTLLGLISHEYFHTWNVKRLRPDALAQIDYTQENLTTLLWFFEGFTSYYDDLLLLRAGRIELATYVQLLGQTLAQVQHTPGRAVHSVAQASFEAWTKYYRPDANTPNATVSYYTKGALVALCLDLSLRLCGHTLDDLMRHLWQRCQGGPMREQDVLDALHAQTGRSWQPELDAWVHGTGELPVLPLLAAHGVRVTHSPPSMAQLLGLRVNEAGGTIRITHVLGGGPAQAAGMAAGDEWLGLHLEPTQGQNSTQNNTQNNAQSAGAAPGWRLRSLDDLPALLGQPLGTQGQPQACVAWVARDQRLLQLPLAWPPQPHPSGLGSPVLSVPAAQPKAWPLA